MNAEQLTEIIMTVKLRNIARAFRRAGYKNCKLVRSLRRASLYDIAVATCDETPSVPDGRGNEFVGTICRQVKGYEQYEFIIVEQLSPIRRGGYLFTKKILIYAK